MFRVALVCMPFFGADRPSIQLGLLCATAERAGIPTDPYHLNLELAARLTPVLYEQLCNHRGRMTGDWLFSVAAFGDAVTGDDQAYVDAFPDEIAKLTGKIGRDVAYLSRLRHEILPAFIDDCFTATDWGAYRVVGFTSTFQQNVASLALARRIREANPGVTILFGGANFEDEMGLEYVRSFPFIDYAVVGEGDIAFPALLRSLAAGQQPEQIPGVAMRRGEEVAFGGPGPPVRDMDALPVPIYDEYFDRLKLLSLFGEEKFGRLIPVESSRGCWWGAKHQCTFCGLNGLGIGYRAKKPDRVLAELSELARRHRVTSFEAVDNILDMKYVTELFSAIEESRTDYTFFYEIKANLTREQIRALYRGGVRSIQPGIESLSTRLLKLMKKGCTMLQNVRLLKWARYYQMKTGWNIIWGFPGETEQDYQQQLAVAKLLSHLEPPGGCGRIWLERFSPYYTDRDRFPIRDIRPERSYEHVYPQHVRLDKIAYFFDYTMDETLPDAVHRELVEWRSEWQRRWDSDRPDTLFFRRTVDSLFIDDDRGPDRRGTYAFHGPLALMYAFCSDTMRTVPQVLDYLHTVPEGLDLAPDDVRWALDEFCRLGLMVGEDGKYLCLALPANPNW